MQKTVISTVCHDGLICHRNRTRQYMVSPRRVLVAAVLIGLVSGSSADAAPLRAGAAKIDITNVDAGPVDGPLHSRALVITDGTTTAVIVTIDVVSLGEIGHIPNDFLGNVRARVEVSSQRM